MRSGGQKGTGARAPANEKWGGAHLLGGQVVRSGAPSSGLEVCPTLISTVFLMVCYVMWFCSGHVTPPFFTKSRLWLWLTFVYEYELQK